MELVLTGKAHNKGMRAHIRTMQALWRLVMPTFLSFLSEAHNECQVELSTKLANDKRERIPELV